MIATQEYGWSQECRAQGRGWPQGTGWAMQQAAAAGYGGWEPLVHAPTDVVAVGAAARRAGLALPSVFVTGNLHDPREGAATLARLTGVGRAAADQGADRMMIYPSPAAKSSDDLARQADHLNRLGAGLAAFGLVLGYHPEEPEMADGAREVSHVLGATDPALVRLCLDPDTIWRGSGRDGAALLAFGRRHADRITALHLRQSRSGVWAEVLGDGDIDHGPLAAGLCGRGRPPLLVVELAYAPDTPRTLAVPDAHRASLAWVRATFAACLPPGA